MLVSNEDSVAIQTGRKCFFAMAATYFFGVFNDNFFKQAALLLAVAAGLSGLQGQATMLFSLPFILFSAHGGWLADRFPKRLVIIAVKILECVAMVIGAYGIVTLNWNWILAMVFLMGLQSTLFGPALNGSIPELYPEWYVTKANAFLKLVTTAAILLGMAAAGVCLDQNWIESEIPFGQLLAAVLVLLIAVIGFASSLAIRQFPQQISTTPFPWTGPLVSMRDTLVFRFDPPLALAVAGDCFFYFISLITVMVINTLGVSQLQLSKSSTSLLAVALMLGICAGSLLAAKITNTSRWTYVLAPASFGLGLFLLGAGIIGENQIEHQFLLLFVALMGAGFCGGIFLIPLTSFIQVRPRANEKGKVIAADNFCAFSSMLLAGQVFTLLDSVFLPSINMLILGGLGVLAGAVFFLFVRYVKE